MMSSTRSEVFRRDFKAAAYMTGYEFAGIFLRAFVGLGSLLWYSSKVVAHRCL